MKLKRTLGIVLTMALLLPILATGLTMPAVAANTTVPAAPVAPTVEGTGAIGFVDGVLAVDPNTKETPDADGDGFVDITTAEEMYWFLLTANSGTIAEGENYELLHSFDMGNHNLSDKSLYADWTCAGTFAGILEGNGNAIFGLKMDKGGYDSSVKNEGVFCTVSGTIQNLDFVKTALYAESQPRYLIKSLTGGHLSNVRNLECAMYGAQIAGMALAASADATIKNCVVSGAIASRGNGGGYVSAFVGSGNNIEISDCQNYATVTSVAKCSGVSAFVAHTYAGAETHYLNLKNLTNYANIIAPGGRCGSMLGVVDRNNGIYSVGSFVLENLVNYGDITTRGLCIDWNNKATGGVGGLVGEIYSANAGNATNILAFKNCTNWGDIIASGTDFSYSIGGIVASLPFGVTLENTYCFGDITYTGTRTDIKAGGFVGSSYTKNAYNTGTGTAGVKADNCAYFGNITAPIAGGIMGNLQCGNIATFHGLYLNNVVVSGTINGTVNGSGLIGTLTKVSTTPLFDLTNVAVNGGFAATVGADTAIQVIAGNHVYMDTANLLPVIANEDGTTTPAVVKDADAQEYDPTTVIGNYATMMGDMDTRNGFVDALNEAVGTHTPWYANEGGVAHPISELTIDGASVDITHGGAIRMALRVDDVSYLSHDTVSIVKEDAVGTSPLLQNGSAIFLIDAGRIMDAANAYTYSIASGDKTYGQRDIALLEVLAGIYGLSNAEEQALIAALVNYVEYTQIAKGQNATAIDTFNQVAGAGTVAKADLTGVALEMNGVHTLAEGYSISLSLDNGFIITASNGENTVNQKVLFTDMDKEVWIGENAVGGKTTVNNMLYIYMTGDSFSEDIHNQAKALVLYQEALAALANPNS